jgi:glucose-1-phosphatase
MGIKTIFFDIQNVILYFHQSKMLSQIAEYCTIPEATVKKIFAEKNWKERYERGEIDSRTLFHYLPQEIREGKGFALWGEAVSNVFDPNDKLLFLLKKLKKTPLKLCILSNICEIHFSYAYTHFPAFHFFDDYLLSYKMGLKKPEKTLFVEALKKTNTAPQEALFIEGIEEYAQKAHSYGLNSTLYQNPALLEQELFKQGCLT